MKYEIKGEVFPVVICKLSDGEAMLTEKGAMLWMTPNIHMNTTGGGIKKMFSKVLTGESMFQNVYKADGAGMIAFGSCFPGKIMPINIIPGRNMILQKSAFLASEMGVELSVHFSKKLSVGLFGGEGFIMQKLSGNGIAFAEVDGDLLKYELEPGQKLLVNTGNVLGFTENVLMDIKMVNGAKNIFLGGEGLFNTELTGPGTVYIQTMPISGIANAIIPYLPKTTNNN